MNTVWIGVCLFVCLFFVALSWMGWGRPGDWREVTGWSKLLPESLDWVESSSRDFAKEESHPDLKWLGHASLQVDWEGIRVLCDPVRSSRVKIAPRMFSIPELAKGAQVDAILLTHAHMDHMDNATLEEIEATQLLVPAGSEAFLSPEVRARHDIVPVQLGEPISMGRLQIIPVPAVHGGWRYPWQKGYFACGYILKSESDALYVSGDTAQGPHFREIGEHFHPRYTVLPIGAYSPKWFLQKRHLNPEEAVDAAQELGCEYMMPYHFGTYRLSLESMAEPLNRLAVTAASRRQKWIFPVAEDSKTVARGPAAL